MRLMLRRAGSKRRELVSARDDDDYRQVRLVSELLDGRQASRQCCSMSRTLNDIWEHICGLTRSLKRPSELVSRLRACSPRWEAAPNRGVLGPSCPAAVAALLLLAGCDIPTLGSCDRTKKSRRKEMCQGFELSFGTGWRCSSLLRHSPGSWKCDAWGLAGSRSKEVVGHVTAERRLRVRAPPAASCLGMYW